MTANAQTDNQRFRTGGEIDGMIGSPLELAAG
jgi:hypothetical protein